MGYAPDAKLLILNADDLAVSHSEDVASFAALDNKFITSATVMVPCPWFMEVAAYVETQHDADLGLHLTFTSEWQTYRWGPVSPRAIVPSLMGPDGYFYANAQEFAKHANLDEVEIETRAQIERARSVGLEPSHLDAHMHALYGTPELFKVLLKVANEYKLPVRMARNIKSFEPALALMGPGNPIPDAIFSPGEDVPASGWKDYYVNILRNLQPGVTEIFVHLAHDDAESQAIMVDHADWGAAWRQREFDAVSSVEFRKALDENHIVLVGWRDIQKIIGGPIVAPKTSPSQGGPMQKLYVLIFRQGNRKLSDDEQRRRTDEVRAWALQQIQQGRGLDPRILGEESERLGDNRGSLNDPQPVIALNFIQAANFEEAIKIAKTHPGLRYGVSIEVRPWADPRVQTMQK